MSTHAPGQTGTSRAQITCDQAASYRSLHDLRRRSVAVVLLRATGSRRVRRIGGIPVTVSDVTLVQRVTGSRPPSSFAVRQTGGPGVSGCDRLVSTGAVYLAYLTPFKLRPHGHQLGLQYFAVGLFEHAGGDVPAPDTRSFANVTAGQQRLPTRISVADARAS